MTTSLGGHPQGVKIWVKNASATVAIKRGTTVYFSSVAANNPAVQFLDGNMNKDYGTGTTKQIDIPYISVSPSAADAATPGAPGRLGVAAADIPANGFGEIITYGYARVLGGGVVTVGEVITTDAAGLAIDAANATHDNPIGVALETLAANQLGWAFIWISPCGVGAAANTNYMGQDY